MRHAPRAALVSIMPTEHLRTLAHYDAIAFRNASHSSCSLARPVGSAGPDPLSQIRRLALPPASRTASTPADRVNPVPPSVRIAERRASTPLSCEGDGPVRVPHPRALAV